MGDWLYLTHLFTYDTLPTKSHTTKKVPFSFLLACCTSVEPKRMEFWTFLRGCCLGIYGVAATQTIILW